MTYFPLDRDILSSSVWAQGTPEQVKVWFYLLVEANPRTGSVEDADPAIALRCGLPLDVTVAALEWLASPDPYSRTKDYDGRRIARLPGGGFLVLNYLRHQGKDHSTPRVRSWRERQAAKRNETVKRVSTVTGTTEKETDKDTDNNNGRSLSPARGRKRPANPLVDRGATITEGNRLVGVISTLANLDPHEVTAKASEFKGRSYVRLDAMPDDRLAHSVNALRTWERRLTGKAEPQIPRAEADVYVSPKAQAREDAANAELRGGIRGDGSLLHDGRHLAAGQDE